MTLHPILLVFISLGVGAALFGSAIKRHLPSARPRPTPRPRLQLETSVVEVREDPHPQPLESWVTAACAVIDGGDSWVGQPKEAGESFLREWWQVETRAQLEQKLHALEADSGPMAWNLIRAFRVAQAGYVAGLWPAATLWGWVRPRAYRLQRTYPSFESIALTYMEGLRIWRGLKLDGSEDDEELAECQQYADEMTESLWASLPFRVDLSLQRFCRASPGLPPRSLGRRT